MRGIPLKASPFTTQRMLGAPLPAEPSVTYLLNEGGTTSTPHDISGPASIGVAALPRSTGTPFYPTADLLRTPLGPGAWVMRKNRAYAQRDRATCCYNRFACAKNWAVSKGEANPCGMAVFDVRWRHIGIVADVWIDRGIRIIKTPGGGTARIARRDPRAGADIPHHDQRKCARDTRHGALRPRIRRHIPMPAAPDRITAREEDQLNAYFAAGRFYRDMPDSKKFAGVVR